MSIIACYSVAQNPARPCPPEILRKIVAVRVPFVNFEGREKTGIIEIRRDLVPDIEALFRFMLQIRFPIDTVKPISEFGWNDTASMLANNTSAFNYRTYVSKSDGKIKLSKHADGSAIDINPLINPDISGSVIEPAGATYDPNRRGTLTPNCPVVQFMERLGWISGSKWKMHRDNMHLEKPA